MKAIITKHWALIGFVLAFILDTQFGFVQAVVKNPTSVQFIHGIGAIILAYFWQNNNTFVKTRGIGARPDDRQPKKP